MKQWGQSAELQRAAELSVLVNTINRMNVRIAQLEQRIADLENKPDPFRPIGGSSGKD